MRGVSQRPRSALAQLFEGFIREAIEAAGGNVLLELAIPQLLIELDEPVAEGDQVFARQLPYRPFEIVHGTHTIKCSTLKNPLAAA